MLKFQNSETLKKLISKYRNSEYSNLDFKSQLNIGSKHEKAELAKDIAAMASQDDGGHILFGFDNNGKPIKTNFEQIKEDQINQILASRTMFIPPGLNGKFINYIYEGENYQVLWIQVPESPYKYPPVFMGEDGVWRSPIRVGATTKYLTAPEAIAYYESKSRDLKNNMIPDISFLSTMKSEPTAKAEILESNLFPIELPNMIWCAPTYCKNNKEIADLCEKPLPVFGLWKGQVYSLWGKQICQQKFYPIITERNSDKEENLNDLINANESYSFITGLIKKTIRDYAIKRGLSYHKESGRLFFPTYYGKPRKFVWYAFKKKAKRLVANYRKKVDGSIDYWFHLALEIEIINMKQGLALKIKPCWHFTTDGIAPVKALRMTSLSSSKNYREDNARILYNTYLWLYFFSKLKSKIVIPLKNNVIKIYTNPIKAEFNVGILNDDIDQREIPPDFSDDEPQIELYEGMEFIEESIYESKDENGGDESEQEENEK